MEVTVSDAAPAGLGDGGRRLWASLLAQDDGLSVDTNPNREVALEACRAKDRCDELDAVVRSESVMIDNGKGQPVAHPAWVEARQQANILKQLIAALRLPDEATGKRPQHRGARGSYAPKAVPSSVSMLDRARAAKAGA
jgi:hypothetical protein